MANWVKNEETIKVFVERLAGLIERTKATNAEIERAMDISQPTFQNVLHGKTMPSIDLVMKCADFFGISVDYLLGRCETEGRQGDYDFEEIRLESYERYLRHKKTEWSLSVKVARAEADGYEAPWPYNLAEAIISEPFPCVMTHDQKEGLMEASKHLNEREQEFVWLYYKLGYSMGEIGKKYDLTAARVQQVVARGLRKMRHARLQDMVRYGYSGSLMRGENKRLEDENRWLEERNKTLRERIEENVKEAERKSKALAVAVEHGIVEVPALDIPIIELDLSIRAYNCLCRAGCRTVEDIVNLVRKDPCGLDRIRNLGKHTKAEIEERLMGFGIDISKLEEERGEELA